MQPQPQSSEKAASTRRHWGAFLFALALAAAMLFYTWTVLDMARRTTDWLLIAPAAVIGVLAAIWAGVGDLRKAPAVQRLVEASRDETVRPVILIGLTIAFACVVPFIGFDVGTAIFILLCLIVQGERSWWKLALAAVGGAALMTWIFVDLLMVRLPVLLV
jgi:hypothetical protein